MGLLRLSRGGRAWEQPRPEPAGPFWNPRKAVAQGACSSQGPGPFVLLPVPISVSCHSPTASDGSSRGSRENSPEALTLGVPEPARKPGHASKAWDSLLELKGF